MQVFLSNFGSGDKTFYGNRNKTFGFKTEI